MARVVLAMSGGVDSSVAAHLLLQSGHEVIGVFMRHGEKSTQVCQVETQPGGEARSAGGNGAQRSPGLGDQQRTALPIHTPRAGHKQGCCTAADAADARRVAGKLGIPFYALDLQQDFGRIVDYFVDDYLMGRTPNPCIRCNQWIKFGRLFDYADDVDAEFVATGHYARMLTGGSLHRGLDADKDQSYALFGIARRHLPRMLLPVGEFEKPEIRRLAGDLGLAVAGKRDSQEICFVTQGHHSDFVRAKAPKRAAETGGEIVTVEGQPVGRHDGYEAFTVGQRKGLGVALGSPYFVVEIQPDTRRVVIGPRESLARSELVAAEANWLVDSNDLPAEVSVQIRYNGSPHAARLELESDARFRVSFHQPQLAIAPGQAAVVYDGSRVLGGGWIV